MPRRNRRTGLPPRRATRTAEAVVNPIFVVTSHIGGFPGREFVTTSSRTAMKVSACRQAKGAEVSILKRKKGGA